MIEERLRISRELHDVVAHHIAVINVQAGVAQHLADTDPAGTRAALTHVREGATNVLDELAALLAVMRQTDEDGVELVPAPDLGRVQELVQSFDATGLTVTLRADELDRELTPTVSCTAYRVVQEALTNAQRHGSGAHVEVAITCDPTQVIVEVSNDTSAERTDSGSSGFGLVGMRERINAVNGSLSTVVTEGRFHLRAVLPTKGSAP